VGAPEGCKQHGRTWDPTLDFTACATTSSKQGLKGYTNLVSTKTPSLLRKNAAALTFSWDHLVKEWEIQAPTFLRILTAAADKHWHMKAESISAKCIPPLCMAGAVLLKTRNKHTSALQSMTSILLNAGHCSSQVYKLKELRHMQHCCLCGSN